MQKRKLKFNILDLAIIVVVICSVAVLAFRDTISEIFEEPQMVTLEVTVDINGAETVRNALSSKEKTVMFEPESGEETVFEMYVKEIEILPGSVTVPERARVTLTCVGYSKLGRYYTENGERIYTNTDCAYILSDIRTEGTVILIEKEA